jgi:hypothetical protein
MFIQSHLLFFKVLLVLHFAISILGQTTIFREAFLLLLGTHAEILCLNQ